MIKCEFTILTIAWDDAPRTLHRMGEEGWSLATVITSNSTPMAAYIFQRAINMAKDVRELQRRMYPDTETDQVVLEMQKEIAALKKDHTELSNRISNLVGSNDSLIKENRGLKKELWDLTAAIGALPIRKI